MANLTRLPPPPPPPRRRRDGGAVDGGDHGPDGASAVGGALHAVDDVTHEPYPDASANEVVADLRRRRSLATWLVGAVVATWVASVWAVGGITAVLAISHSSHLEGFVRFAFPSVFGSGVLLAAVGRVVTYLGRRG